MWQTIKELTGQAPECYLFHRAGVLDIKVVEGEQDVAMRDPQGKSPYLKNILAKGVYEQEWTMTTTCAGKFARSSRGTWVSRPRPIRAMS